jgi:hypothetical protein
MKLFLLHCPPSLQIVFISIIFISTGIILLDSNHNSKYGVYAHMPTSNISRIQEWTDSQNGFKIQFIYEPEKPIIDTFTELKFSVENITTGDHISETKEAVARVVVTNGQRLFNFENISVGNDGHFSVRYLFPDDGTHQAILRLDTKDSSTVSSFNVFVPHQAPPNILNPFPSSPTGGSNNQQITMTVLLIGIISSIAAVTIFLMKRK